MLIGVKRFITNKNTITIIAIIGSLCLLYWAYNKRIEDATSPKAVVTAINEIGPRTLITSDLITVKKIPGKVIEGAYTSTSQVVGKYVSNDAVIDNKLTIITGSNMSGKTTYMRTIAINMVLAYVGAGVCAKSFSVPKMKLFTSMRIRDDVSGGISTFYAEILRIKEMSEYILSAKSDEEAVPALCLIDEIFKGTNSADRIVGASEALKKLSGGDSLVIVTTHDFELCDLTTQDGTPASNYHFEEYYLNGELKFDYKLKNGKCTTRNAMALLVMAGLV
jgi:DNA mismatch repair ATPase MutS